MAATALCRGPDGVWGVLPRPATGRFVATSDAAGEALARDQFAAFTAWLAQLSAAADGQSVHMLAHNGNAHDWRHLGRHLQRFGLQLPGAVAVGDSKQLFLAEKQEALIKPMTGRQLWSMEKI